MIPYTRRRLGGRQPLWGMGVTSLIMLTSRPAACRLRIAASRPEPGPLTYTSTVFRPNSIAALAAVSAAICAAIGLCIPAVVTLTIVTAIYDAIKDNYWVWSALKGVQCAVAPIIGGAAISLGKDALTSAMPIIICAVAFVLCCFTSISNLTLVVAGVVIALVWMGVSEHGRS